MKGVQALATVLLVGAISLSTNLLGFSMVLEGMMHEEVASFTLEDTTDTIRSMSDYQGKKVLLFFFGKNHESDFEDADFRYSYNNEHLVLLDRLNPWFVKNNIFVLGISDYTKEELKSLAVRDNVTLTLLSDARSRLIAYLYRTADSSVGIERSIFLIDEEGKISYALQSSDPTELVVTSLIEIIKKSDVDEVLTKRLLHKPEDSKSIFATENKKMQDLVNGKAPLFTLKNSEGGECSLQDYQGKKVLLCFFKRFLEDEVGNPCETFEAVISTFSCLNELKQWFEKQNIEFLTVFNDLPKDVLFLKNKRCKGITLHDTQEQDVMQKYEVVMKNEYQRLKQASFFLDEQGIVRIATDVRSVFEQMYHILTYLLRQED